MKKNLLLILVLVVAMFWGCTAQDQAAENNAVADVEEATEAVETTEETTEEIDQALTYEGLMTLMDEGALLVDTRLNDSFNGWDLDGKPGHIEGAVDFSFQWLGAEEALLAETLANKGMTVDSQIVLYDTDLSKAEMVEAYLLENGFTNVQVFDLNKWEGDLVKYENYHLIVPAVIVKDILDGNKPESFENAGTIKIVEASWGAASNSYDKGHVPTAFHIDTDNIEPPTEEEPIMWMLTDDESLEAFALRFGFTSEDTVILTSEEPLAAYRMATVLKYIGVKDARVLNGGTRAWTDAGFELETEAHEATPVEAFGVEVPLRPEVIVTIPELKEYLQEDDFTLVDNRTWEEYIGETPGYSYHDKAGRIEGAKFGYAGEGNAYSMSYFRNPDLTMRRPEEFVALWEGQDIDINNRLAFMCGSGWRAAEIMYFADVYGIEDVSLYSDGWIGWSNYGNPIVVGDPN